jgi:hypothetical protein
MKARRIRTADLLGVAQEVLLVGEMSTCGDECGGGEAPVSGGEHLPGAARRVGLPEAAIDCGGACFVSPVVLG